MPHDPEDGLIPQVGRHLKGNRGKYSTGTGAVGLGGLILLLLTGGDEALQRFVTTADQGRDLQLTVREVLLERDHQDEQIRELKDKVEALEHQVDRLEGRIEGSGP